MYDMKYSIKNIKIKMFGLIRKLYNKQCFSIRAFKAFKKSFNALNYLIENGIKNDYFINVMSMFLSYVF